jgi:hypothetical protein
LNEWLAARIMACMSNTVFFPHAIEALQHQIDAASPSTPARPETPRELRRQRRAAAARGRS